MSPDELLGRMREGGSNVTLAVIRWHCRNPRGRLHGRAYLVGRSWVIPENDAMVFMSQWRRYGRYPQK